MGQQPAKFFPGPTPYGNSPDIGTIAQAKAASPAPLNNFLPLNPQNPPDETQAQPQTPQVGTQGLFGGLAGNLAGGIPNINRYFQLGGGIRRNMDL